MGDDRPDDIVETGRPKRPPPTLELSATEQARDEAPIADGPPEQSGPGAEERTPERRGAGIAVAAVSGAVAGAVVAGLAWFATSTWLTSTPEIQSPAPQVNLATIDNLSARLGKLESRPLPAPPPAPAPPDLTAITSRLDALDKSAAALRDETTALRTQSTQALAAASEAQKEAQAPSAPAAPDLSGITGRLAAVESNVQAQDAKIAEQARKPADELATRRIAAASLLDGQVRSGEPFVAALAAAKGLASDAAKLAPLDAFAASGVPSAETLTRELFSLPQIKPSSDSTAASGGLIERLKSGAANFVTIERTDAPNADNAVFVRAADAARRNDLGSAAKDLAALPPAERQVVQLWLDRVAAREAARAASRQFADDALAAMSKPKAAP